MSEVMLVARREFTERLREKSFLISNGVLVGLLLIGGILPALFADDDALRLGTLGPEGAAVGAAAEATSEAFEVDLEITEVGDRTAAEAAVRDGELDAVVVDAQTVIVDSELPGDLEPLLRTASADVQAARTLREAGLSPEQLAALSTPAELEVQRLGEASSFEPGPAFFFGLVAVTVLYGLLILYGQWVAQGVVEEKSSRVVEVLLSTLRPSQLLLGKVLGLGALGILQILLLVAVAVAVLSFTGFLEIPQEAYGTLALVAAWFVLGYALYATVFAVAGSIVSRVEDLQATATPVYALLIGAFFAAQLTISVPNSAAARIAALVPFSAPLVQPLRWASGASTWWEMVAAVALTLLTIGLLIPLAARLYSGGVLQVNRRIGLRDAWRSAGR